MHKEMVNQFSPRRSQRFAESWELRTNFCYAFTNVGSFSLDCQTSAAGHARPGFRAGGDGYDYAAGSHALHAAAGIDASTAAGDAVPSCHGAIQGVPPRIRVSSL